MYAQRTYTGGKREKQGEAMGSDDPSSGKTERLNVRLSPRRRALLEAASKAEDTTISEFVLASATRTAETRSIRRSSAVGYADLTHRAQPHG